MEVKISHYKIFLNQKIGNGSFGYIYKGIMYESNRSKYTHK